MSEAIRSMVSAGHDSVARSRDGSGDSPVVAAPADAPETLAADEHRLLRRLIGALITAAVMTSLLLAVPPLRRVAATIAHISPGWLAAAIALELASGASFVVVFRLFFERLPAPAARELAWTEMGSGALLPGGGVGAYAVGGWLLHRAGMSPQRIVERSSGLFFLTSATNVAAMAGAGVLLAAGAGRGPRDFLHAVAPIIAAGTASAVVLALPRLVSSRRARGGFAGDLVAGIGAAVRAFRRPHWRLLGAVGYLGFDIAVLWVTIAATGRPMPAAALVLAYLIGYLANLIPVPGGVGVLEGGLAGMLILYGAPATQAAAAVVVYHAIAFWIPSLGGLGGYWRLRCRLRDAHPHEARAGAPELATAMVALAEPCHRQRPPVRDPRTAEPVAAQTDTARAA